MNSNVINWTDVISVVGEDNVRQFAAGNLSADSFYCLMNYTEISGRVRSVLRERGASELRKLARKALSRR